MAGECVVLSMAALPGPVGRKDETMGSMAADIIHPGVVRKGPMSTVMTDHEY